MTGERKTITVRVSLTLTVDPAEWAADNGIDPRDVRADVRAYVENLVRESYGAGFFQSVTVAS